MHSTELTGKGGVVRPVVRNCFVGGKLMRRDAVRVLGLLGKDYRNHQLCFADTMKASFSPTHPLLDCRRP